MGSAAGGIDGGLRLLAGHRGRQRRHRLDDSFDGSEGVAARTQIDEKGRERAVDQLLLAVECQNGFVELALDLGHVWNLQLQPDKLQQIDLPKPSECETNQVGVNKTTSTRERSSSRLI